MPRAKRHGGKSNDDGAKLVDMGRTDADRAFFEVGRRESTEQRTPLDNVHDVLYSVLRYLKEGKSRLSMVLMPRDESLMFVMSSSDASMSDVCWR